MSAQIAAYGRLAADPRAHETRTGKPMTTARIAVTVDAREGRETGEGTLWLDVVAFGYAAEGLARHAKGEPVSVSGRMELSRWTARNGEERERWRVIADAVVSVRSVRPKGGRRRGDYAGGSASPPRQPATQPARDGQLPFDDPLPF